MLVDLMGSDGICVGGWTAVTRTGAVQHSCQSRGMVAHSIFSVRMRTRASRRADRVITTTSTRCTGETQMPKASEAQHTAHSRSVDDTESHTDGEGVRTGAARSEVMTWRISDLKRDVEGHE